MAIIKGKYIRFYVTEGGVKKPVFHATNLDLEFGADTETTTTKDGIITDISSRTWSGSGEGLMVDSENNQNNFQLLHEQYMKENPIDVEIGLPTGNSMYTGAPLIEGKAVISSLSVSAPAEGKATVSYSFEGQDEATVTYPTV